MFWFGIVLLALGSLLLGFTNPWQFPAEADRGFFDWTEVFWYLQWGGFWLVTASLLVFGDRAWRSPTLFSVHWKLVPPGIAFALFILFFFCSTPEKSNQADWKNGWLGARVYWRTKIWRVGDNGDEQALPDRLAGRWEAPGGFAFTISRDTVRMTTPSGNAEWKSRTCPWRFPMDYDFTFRSSPIQQAITPPGFAFERLGAVPPEDILKLSDRRFPRRYCSCDSKTTTWILVDIDRLLAFPDHDNALIARRALSLL